MIKSEIEAMYPKGTIVELTEILVDPYGASKPAGARFMVNGVDDAGQLHGSWLPPQKGSIALIVGVDKFKKL